jgi:Ca2+-binding RTX toxin-like protein
MDGGAGDDRLAGGSGSDIFVSAPGAGADTNIRFVDGRGRADDRIEVSAYGFSSVRNIGMGQDGADVVLTLVVVIRCG